MNAIRAILEGLEEILDTLPDDERKAKWELLLQARQELIELEPPQGYGSWKDAAVDERRQRVKAEQELKDFMALQPNRDALVAIFKSLRGHRNLAEMVQGHILHWRNALRFSQSATSSEADLSLLAHEQRALDDIENACKVHMEQASSVVMAAESDANTIYVTAYGPDGKRTSSYSTTSFDTAHETNVMTGALELERAVRLRNVQFTPFKLGSLRIEPHMEEHGIYFTISGGPRDGERIMLDSRTHHGSFHYERYKRQDIPEMGLRTYKVDAEKRILIFQP